MPLINVKLIEDVFTPEGENMRPVTSVVVDELASGHWGIGCKPLSTEDVTALAAGVPANV